MSEPIYIYTTTTGGSLVLHRTERAQLLLSGVAAAKGRVQVVYLDVEQDKRQKVWDISGKKGVYPLIFVGDKFVGDVEAIEEENEAGELANLLK
eukprot:TRINITY_DN1376_c0_g1_i1.p1 TRINITY_DN1376_c0_g1~~TRINITY_DN1376_c0_g1_i1.p1  ORF type:complete len:107 (+),score=22.36 TRINITY_DN1376_c0_g1_i1:42-323(+)